MHFLQTCMNALYVHANKWQMGFIIIIFFYFLLILNIRLKNTKEIQQFYLSSLWQQMPQTDYWMSYLKQMEGTDQIIHSKQVHVCVANPYLMRLYSISAINPFETNTKNNNKNHAIKKMYEKMIRSMRCGKI